MAEKKTHVESEPIRRELLTSARFQCVLETSAGRAGPTEWARFAKAIKTCIFFYFRTCKYIFVGSNESESLIRPKTKAGSEMDCLAACFYNYGVSDFMFLWNAFLMFSFISLFFCLNFVTKMSEICPGIAFIQNHSSYFHFS